VAYANRLIFILLLCCLVAGCGKAKEAKTARTSLEPTVRVEQPEIRTITRSIAQPGVIEPYEQTAVFSKVSGFVQKWHVDIGA
jgi:multidrug efflux pump subunit AcrA (membrane-fusion protein)